nr:acyl carrier protein [Kibdelosporangium sp. MJ126-NF4]CEL20589.1 Acyl carrier protein [Kibdelosporangium sp. MJ126-NF4]CTQ89500.1 Acyl carrier protein [Kibdelosporangium sp. MJ126-NF4]
MAGESVTIDDLKRILREGAGVDEGVDLDGDIMDAEFDELGYDSVALLETASRITREYGVQIDDDIATGATTPRQLLAVINGG